MSVTSGVPPSHVALSFNKPPTHTVCKSRDVDGDLLKSIKHPQWCWKRKQSSVEKLWHFHCPVCVQTTNGIKAPRQTAARHEHQNDHGCLHQVGQQILLHESRRTLFSSGFQCSDRRDALELLQQMILWSQGHVISPSDWSLSEIPSSASE